MNKYQFDKTDGDFYMDVSMVSEYMHVAKSTIYKWVEEKYIPHNRFENFEMRDIYEALMIIMIKSFNKFLTV